MGTVMDKGIRVEGLQQNTQEWLDWREGGIGGSEASAIMGTNPFTTVIECWQHKLHLIPPIQTNAAMQRGHDLEPDARFIFELEYGIKMPPICIIHPEHDFMRASLDGLSTDGNIVLEIKCPGLTTHREALAGKIKPYYYTQMQHQMAVAGAELCYYFSYTDLPDIEPTVKMEVPRDEEYIKRLTEREAIFWEYVLNNVEPDTSRFAVKDAGGLNGDTRTDPAWKNALQELLGARNVLLDAQSQYDLRESRINDLMGKKKQVVIIDNGVRIERIHTGDKWETIVTVQEDELI
jgi:putative phage-type endonuclease